MPPTPMPIPQIGPILDGATQVVAWFKDNTTLIVGFSIFAYMMNRIITAVGGKSKKTTTSSSSTAATVTQKSDGSTTIEIS
jgi:hypothetical protein